jgi:hypothetical protein
MKTKLNSAKLILTRHMKIYLLTWVIKQKKLFLSGNQISWFERAERKEEITSVNYCN